MNLDTGKPFEDGGHILYVNGEYRGNSDIGKLMHDFNCTDTNDMNFERMADRTRYLKENPEGVSQMCKVIEDMRKEEREEAAKAEKKEPCSVCWLTALLSWKKLPSILASLLTQ